MICPPCTREADADQQRRTNLPDWPIAHDPAICRDAAIQPHGCTCQHGQRNTTPSNEQLPAEWRSA